MAATYPDLQLLEHIFDQYVVENTSPDETYIPDVEAYVFPQTWPNTGGGLAQRGYMYGQAFTTEYTTVFINRRKQLGMVAFGL